MDKKNGIARIWRGRTTTANADFYQEYLYTKGVLKLKSLGATEVQMLREDQPQESHFMVISWWPERQAMTSWAGGDPNRIRHLERDAELLIELPESVQVCDVRYRLTGDA
jgi:heme-degrading monooxygenase HmoA